MKLNLKHLVILSLIVLTLAACATPTPEPTPTPQYVGPCTYTVKSGDGWNRIIEVLGITSQTKIVQNGVETYPTGNLQPDDVISVADPIACTGELIAARQVHLSTIHGEERELSGFQNPITMARVNNALSQACGGVRWSQGFGFNNDIVNGGCAYQTIIKVSYDNGAIVCSEYPTVYEAYEGTLSMMEISTVKWFAALVLPESGNAQELCK